jgi:integrase
MAPPHGFSSRTGTVGRSSMTNRSQRRVQKTVARWADYAGLGKVTPHDFRRTAITEMLKTYPVQEALMASNHRDVQTLMGHGQDYENLERNLLNIFRYD